MWEVFEPRGADCNINCMACADFIAMNQQDSFQTACFVFYETCFPLYNSSQSTGRLKVSYVFIPTQTHPDH